MLTSAGVRNLRGFVRFSQGFLQRRSVFSWRKTEAFLRQTSSPRQTIPSAFVKGLCTRTEVGSTLNLSNANDTEYGESESKVDKQEKMSLTAEKVFHSQNNIADIQNRQERTTNSDEKDSHFRSTNIPSDKKQGNNDIELKKDSKSPNNIGTISEGYPIPDPPRFQLSADWKQKKENSPGIKFSGDIYFIKNYKDEIEHKEILEQFLDEDVLGFDTEHCPVEHLVCVVQLASQDKAVLWQCTHFKRKIPPFLKEILTGKVAKVGHACVDDAIMISNQYNIEPVNLIDTYCWARDLYCSHKSLQGLCAIFLNEFLSKKHQRSDWKKAYLSPGQIRYAATDAWISLKVYQEMKRHGKELGVNLTPIYKNLQQWQAEVKDNQRQRRKRRRERVKERKQEILSQVEIVKQIGANEEENEKTDTITKQAGMSETLNKGQNKENEAFEKEYEVEVRTKNKVGNGQISHISDDIDSEQDEKLDNDIGKSSDKKSKGSRRRTKKFLAKFHPLE